MHYPIPEEAVEAEGVAGPGFVTIKTFFFEEASAE
jgi:hypothetical protein